MRLHEGTTLVACEILPVAKTMGLSHAASRILPLRDLSTLPIQQSFGYRVLSKDGFSWEIKPKKVNIGRNNDYLHSNSDISVIQSYGVVTP